MIQNELPTFRRWGKKLLEWKRAIIIVVLILGIKLAVTNYLKGYYAVIEPCDQPCQDAVTCDPIEFTFEVTPGKIKLGQPNYIWYRAKIKNRSCRELSPIGVDGFLHSENLWKSASPLWVSVSGPDGREIQRLPVPGPDGGIAWEYGGSRGVSISTEGTVHPYQPNWELIDRMRGLDRVRGSGFVSLMPGESFETVTSVLRPYRIVATSVRTEDGGLAHGYGKVRVENPPHFPTPPEGFIYLDRYQFARPGKYTITAGYRYQFSVYPIFARWENRSPWLGFFSAGAYPSRLDSKQGEVNLIAPPVTLEVVK